jgi:hypothetical protein
MLCHDDDVKSPPPPRNCFFTDKLTHIMHKIWMIKFIQSRRLKIWSSQPISCLGYAYGRSTQSVMFVDFGAPFMTVSKGHCQNDSICSILELLKLILLKVKSDRNWKFPKTDAPQPTFPPKTHARMCLGHFTATPSKLCIIQYDKGIPHKNLGTPQIGDRTKAPHQARFHSSPIHRSPNLVLKLAKFGSSELIQIHPNCQIWLSGWPK